MNTSLSNMIDDLFSGNIYRNFRDDVPVNGFRPLVNITEDNDGYRMEFRIPGINKEDIKIEIENKTLVVAYDHKAETKKEDEKVIRREFAQKSFKRSFTIGDTIESDKIEASFENGILTLSLPKKEEVKPVKKLISIQ